MGLEGFSPPTQILYYQKVISHFNAARGTCFQASLFIGSWRYRTSFLHRLSVDQGRTCNAGGRSTTKTTKGHRKRRRIGRPTTRPVRCLWVVANCTITHTVSSRNIMVQGYTHAQTPTIQRPSINVNIVLQYQHQHRYASTAPSSWMLAVWTSLNYLYKPRAVAFLYYCLLAFVLILMTVVTP